MEGRESSVDGQVRKEEVMWGLGLEQGGVRGMAVGVGVECGGCWQLAGKDGGEGQRGRGSCQEVCTHLSLFCLLHFMICHREKVP